MDSIEKMRKLNELTKELKQHGFAQSSFEAIQQANQIYGDDKLTDEVKHGMIGAQDKMMNEEDRTASTEVEKKIGKLNENIELLTDKMNEIVKAINDIDQRINLIKNRPAERIIERQVQHEAPQSKETHEAPAETHTESKGDYANQRVGNYQSNDVAIDKMFYYGKK